MQEHISHARKDVLYGTSFLTFCGFAVSAMQANVAGAVACTVLLMLMLMTLSSEVIKVHFQSQEKVEPRLVQIC